MTIDRLMEEARKFLEGPMNFFAAEDALRRALAGLTAARRQPLRACWWGRLEIAENFHRQMATDARPMRD